jgi:hypothetical protein
MDASRTETITEQYVRLKDVTTVLRNELPPGTSYSSIYRWVTLGCCGVRLKAERFGGRWWTTASDVREFISAVAAKVEDRLKSEVVAHE